MCFAEFHIQRCIRAYASDTGIRIRIAVTRERFHGVAFICLQRYDKRFPAVQTGAVLNGSSVYIFHTDAAVFRFITGERVCGVFIQYLHRIDIALQNGIANDSFHIVESDACEIRTGNDLVRHRRRNIYVITVDPYRSVDFISNVFFTIGNEGQRLIAGFFLENIHLFFGENDKGRSGAFGMHIDFHRCGSAAVCYGHILLTGFGEGFGAEFGVGSVQRINSAVGGFQFKNHTGGIKRPAVIIGKLIRRSFHRQRDRVDVLFPIEERRGGTVAHIFGAVGGEQTVQFGIFTESNGERSVNRHGIDKICTIVTAEKRKISLCNIIVLIIICICGSIARRG